MKAQIRELCGVKKGLDERIDDVERDRIVKRVHVGESAGSRSVGMPRKRWIDAVKECLKKRFGCQVSKENGPG